MSTPRIDASASVHASVVLDGDVTIGPGARLLPYAVVDGTQGAVTIGADCVVMEHALVRGREAHAAAIGGAVMVGPYAHVNGARVGDEAFLAARSSLYPGAVVGAAAEVRIGGVVHVNTVLAPGQVVPIGWIAAGDPAQLFSPDRHDELWEVQRTLDFPGTAYGVPRGTAMREIMRGQSEAYRARLEPRD